MEEHPHPFKREYSPWTVREVTKMVLMSICLVPLIRLVLLVILTVLSIGLIHISCEPWSLHAIRKLMRLMLIVCGFYRIPITDHRHEEPEIRPKLIVIAPHVTMFDMLFFTWYLGCGGMGKKEIADIPLMGRMFRDWPGNVAVDRFSKEGKQKAENDIKARAQDPNAVPLAIFPEGTTGSSRVLKFFMGGAFNPGEPVQPVLLDFSQNKYCDLAFLGSTAFCLFWAFCQFENKVRISFLPPYVPSGIEKANPFLYANNVRLAMMDVRYNPSYRRYSLDNRGVEDVHFRQKLDAVPFPVREQIKDLIVIADIKHKLRIHMEQLLEVLKLYQDQKDGVLIGDIRKLLPTLPRKIEQNVLLGFLGFDGSDGWEVSLDQCMSMLVAVSLQPR